MKRGLYAVGLLVLMASAAFSGNDRLGGDLRVDGDLTIVGGIVVGGNLTIGVDLDVNHNLNVDNTATIAELDAAVAYADTIKAGSGATLKLRAADGRNDAALSVYNLTLTNDATMDSLYCADNVTLATGKTLKTKLVSLIAYTGVFPAPNTLPANTLVTRADTLYMSNLSRAGWIAMN